MPLLVPDSASYDNPVTPPCHDLLMTQRQNIQPATARRPADS